MPLDRFNTGFSAELFVAAELARRDYKVGITFGRTKSIDIFAEKDGHKFAVQVKGIKRRENNHFQIKVSSIIPDIYYILVNTNRINLGEPIKYAILQSNEVIANLRYGQNVEDNAVNPNVLDNENYRNRWDRLP